MAKSDRSLSVEERALISGAIQKAMGWVGANDDPTKPRTPQQLHELICIAVDGFRKQPDSERKKLLAESALGLGSLWGQVLCDQFAWNWIMMRVDDKDEDYGVVPPNRSHLIYPLRFVNGLLANVKREHTCGKIYDAIKNGKLPKALPKGYMLVGGGGSTMLF